MGFVKMGCVAGWGNPGDWDYFECLWGYETLKKKQTHGPHGLSMEISKENLMVSFFY